jgi:hypothetical protein
MKLKITQAPYKHDYELNPPKDTKDLADEDYKIVKKLMQQGKEQEARDFVNERLLNSELQYTSRNPKQAGVPTKTYAHQMIGKHLLEENPEANRYLSGGHLEKGANELLKNLHPKYEEYMQRAYEKGPLFEKLKKVIYGGYTPKITAIDRDLDKETPDATGSFNPSVGVRMSPYQGVDSYAATLKHELDHALNFAGERLSNEEDFIKDYPEYKNFKKEEFQSKPEVGYINPVIPNLKDYDFKKGEFNSNYVRDPIDLAEEVTSGHRYGRTNLFEELRKKLK